MFKSLNHIIFVIFGTKTNKHSGIVLLGCEFLQLYPVLIDFNPRRPVFSNYAVPKCLITVKNKYFRSGNKNRIDFTDNHSSQRNEKIRTIGDMTVLMSQLIIIVRN